MPADSTGCVFLWVNRDAENFKSRDHTKISKSYIRKAKHLKDWKHSKLRSSVSKTYFPWTFCPDRVSFWRTLSESTRVLAEAKTTPPFDASTHQPVPWSYPAIGPDVYQQSEAKHPSEIPPDTQTGRETGPLDSLLSAQSYCLDVVAESISFAEEALSGAVTSSSGSPDPTAFGYDLRNPTISPPGKATNRLPGECDHLNPSQAYPQNFSCQFRHPMHGGSEARQAQPEAAYPSPDIRSIRRYAGELSGLERPTLRPDFSRLPDQATESYIMMLSNDEVLPNLDYLPDAHGQSDGEANQQTTSSMEASVQPADRRYCEWTFQDQWSSIIEYTGCADPLRGGPFRPAELILASSHLRVDHIRAKDIWRVFNGRGGVLLLMI